MRSFPTWETGKSIRRYSEDGKTKIGMMKPSAMLKALSDSPALARVAQDVEEAIIEIIADAK